MKNSGLRRIKLIGVLLSASGLAGCLGGGGGGGVAAFAAGYTGDAVRVGMVDSGVDANHSELTGRITAGGD